MAALLAALLLQVAAPPQDVAPVTVTGQPRTPPPADAKILVAADQDTLGHEVAIWPAGALARGAHGQVVLACRVDVHGLAERCRVAFEDPPSQGFGKAALALRPTFKLTPRQGPKGPIDSEMNVAVEFRPPEGGSNLRQVLAVAREVPPEASDNFANAGGHEINGRNLMSYGNPVATRRITMLDTPAWAAAPGFEALAAAYPAEGGGVEGYAVAHCKVDRVGVLTRCKVAKETPGGRGFGKAAVGLAAQFRVPAEAMAEAPRGAPVEVDVPVRFPAPGKAQDRIVWSPAWLTGVDADTARRYFPAEAAAQGVKSGKAVVLCRIGEDGALSACAPELAKPDGLGFDEAAVRVAATLRMSLWSAEAGPVKGGQVHVPIELDLPSP